MVATAAKLALVVGGGGVAAVVLSLLAVALLVAKVEMVGELASVCLVMGGLVVALVVVTQILAIALAAILTGVVATAYTAQVQRRESLYEMEVREVLADGVVTDEEKQKLKTLQAKFGMSNEQVEAIARQVATEKKSAS